VIAEAGLAALWLATGFALVQVMLAWGAARGAEREGGPMVMTALRRVTIVQGLLALAAFGLLITLFVQSDMSVLLVVENSHSLKPLIYKIAGAWGNHEGSMLLWVTVLAVSGQGWRSSRSASPPPRSRRRWARRRRSRSASMPFSPSPRIRSFG
jgi:cytochrome c-type biogenesis protein CcmF